MEDFLMFRRMITPIFIHIFFWIGVAVCVLLGLIAIVAGAASGGREGGGAVVLGGLFWLFVGPILVRIYCEVLIIFFRIYDTLKDIREAVDKSSAAPGGEIPRP